jgi:hypothetical protein
MNGAPGVVLNGSLVAAGRAVHRPRGSPNHCEMAASLSTGRKRSVHQWRHRGFIRRNRPFRPPHVPVPRSSRRIRLPAAAWLTVSVRRTGGAVIRRVRHGRPFWLRTSRSTVQKGAFAHLPTQKRMPTRGRGRPARDRHGGMSARPKTRPLPSALA